MRGGVIDQVGDPPLLGKIRGELGIHLGGMAAEKRLLGIAHHLLGAAAKAVRGLEEGLRGYCILGQSRLEPWGLRKGRGFGFERRIHRVTSGAVNIWYNDVLLNWLCLDLSIPICRVRHRWLLSMAPVHSRPDR